MAAELPPFTLLVGTIGTRPVRFSFNQPKVLVGRGLEADLRIEHAGVSRAQLVIERGVGSAGEPRFRITPLSSTNPTLVNDHPAVEGTLMPGDSIAVTEVRISLERGEVKRLPAETKKKQQVSPLRAVLLTLVIGMVGYVGWLTMQSQEDSSAAEFAHAPAKLFLPQAEVHCGSATECDTRAHDAYARGKRLVAQVGADPGNLYRAALEFDKATHFRQQSGLPLGDIADVAAQAEQARTRAEADFQDARFRLSRAIAAEDHRRCADEAALLARLVPDDHHPYRIRLDAYRRTLPNPAQPGTENQ